MRPATRMDGPNRFKLGLFCTNSSGGVAMTKVSERWEASWVNNLRVTRMAEAAGWEFTLPIARWHGYQGTTDTQGSSMEPLTWATALLASTEAITVFGTLHVPLINPVFAAKQIVTADLVGHGRFGLNMVSGWHPYEFEMFGIELREHDERYAFTEEWLEIATRIWSETLPFDYKGRYFNLKGVSLSPAPYGGGRPLLMSAGSSPAGRGFAAKHVDCIFAAFPDLEALPGEIASIRQMAGLRSIGVYASGHMVCRRSRREAEEYYRYYTYEMGDWDAVEHTLEIRGQSQSIPSEKLETIKERIVSGVGTFPIVGSLDDCAETFRRMSEGGLDGMALGLVNYINELPFLEAELLPRLERLGLRGPVTR